MLPGSHCSCDPPSLLSPAFPSPGPAVMHCFIPSGGFGGAFQCPLHPIPPYSVLTLLNAEAAGPLLQGDVLVVVQVASLEEAGGAVLHGDEGGTEGGQLGVGQVPAKVTAWSICRLPPPATLPQEGRCSARCGGQHGARCWPQLSIWFDCCPSALPVSATECHEGQGLVSTFATGCASHKIAGGPHQLPQPHGSLCVIALTPISSSQLSQQLLFQLLKLSQGLWTKIF